MSINRLVVVVHKQTIYDLKYFDHEQYVWNGVVSRYHDFMSTSSTLCVSSNNDGDHDIFMVTEDQTTMHDAGIGMSKVRYMHVLDCS